MLGSRYILPVCQKHLELGLAQGLKKPLEEMAAAATFYVEYAVHVVLVIKDNFYITLKKKVN